MTPKMRWLYTKESYDRPMEDIFIKEIKAVEPKPLPKPEPADSTKTE